MTCLRPEGNQKPTAEAVWMVVVIALGLSAWVVQQEKKFAETVLHSTGPGIFTDAVRYTFVLSINGIHRTAHDHIAMMRDDNNHIDKSIVCLRWRGFA